MSTDAGLLKLYLEPTYLEKELEEDTNIFKDFKDVVASLFTQCRETTKPKIEETTQHVMFQIILRNITV
jgi:hypothetical protein